MKEGKNRVNIIMILIHYTLSAKTQQHMVAISQLESLVHSSQKLLQKQVNKCMDQMEKITIANKDNEKMILDTQKLLEEINIIKKNSQAQYCS